jgi:DMSO/TMAO reductase YedYZ heme-binding membrane subunit
MLLYAVALVSGILVKVVDWFDDDLKSKSILKYGFALLYGVLIGYLIGNATFSMIFLAGVMAQIFARKIDTLAHKIGFVTAIVVALFFSVPAIDIYLLSYFLILAFFDEIDYVGKLRKLNEYRPFLKLGAVPLALLGRPDYLVAILAFDVGYEGFNLIQYKIKQRK